MKEMQEKTFPSILSNFEKQASTSNAPEGWMFGKVRNSYCCSYILTSGVYRHVSHVLRPTQC